MSLESRKQILIDYLKGSAQNHFDLASITQDLTKVRNKRHEVNLELSHAYQCRYIARTLEQGGIP